MAGTFPTETYCFASHCAALTSEKPYYRSQNIRISRRVAPTRKQQRSYIVSDKTYKAKDYPRRQTSPDIVEINDQFIQALVEQLDAYEERSQPSVGQATANEKDMKAFSALECAGELVDDLAGWAIDHTVGLALNGRRWVPLQPSGVKSHPEYLAEREAVDDHIHEKTGGAQTSYRKLDPAMCRKIFLGLLQPNPGGFPEEIHAMMVEALEALDFGETLSILKPAENARKRKWRELRLQLKAIVFVEFRKAMGMTKEAARERVGQAYGQSATTVRLWVGRLRTELSGLEVSRNIEFAKIRALAARDQEKKIAAGARERSTGTAQYGDEALAAAGKRYQEILREE
jgi:hypothetical protein